MSNGNRIGVQTEVTDYRQEKVDRHSLIHGSAQKISAVGDAYVCAE